MERIDKILALHNYGSRKEVGGLIRSGAVTVNGAPVKKPDLKIDPERDEVRVSGERAVLRRRVVLMMHKPAGVLSATRDGKGETVLDLLPPELGLLILTDDGDLAHRMLAPKSHVYKLYEARLDKPASPEDAEAFARGLQAGELECLPAELTFTGDPLTVRVRVREGKFHQVKRMFHAVGKEVTALKRLSIGKLQLDPLLAPGEARLLTAAEEALIFE